VYRVVDGFVLCSVFCISVFCWLSFQQHHASILFPVYKKFGSFLCSLQSTTLRSIEVGHSCVYVIYMCVCVPTDNRQCLIFVVLIHMTVHLFVCIHLTLGSHLVLYLYVRLPPPQRFHVRSILAHCMLEGLYRNVGPSNDDGNALF